MGIGGGELFVYIFLIMLTHFNISFIYLFTCRVVLAVMGAIVAKPVSQRQRVRKLSQNFAFGGNGRIRMTNTPINHRREGHRYTQEM